MLYLSLADRAITYEFVLLRGGYWHTEPEKDY